MKDYYPNCHCYLLDIPRPQVTVECPEEKFERYVFSPKYEYKGKKKLFLEWGYDKINTEYLVEELTRQAKEKYAMKEYDYVEVTVEKEKYAKQGVHKGMRGTILDPRNIDGQWLVFFEDDPYGTAIKEEDLKLIYDSPTEYIVEVKLLNEDHESQGVRMGEVGRVLDVMNVVDNKWEVDFSGKTLLLRRDEMELVGDFDEISKQA